MLAEIMLTYRILISIGHINSDIIALGVKRDSYSYAVRKCFMKIDLTAIILNLYFLYSKYF